MNNRILLFYTLLVLVTLNTSGAYTQSEFEISDFFTISNPVIGTFEIKNSFDFSIAGRVDKGTIKYEAPKHLFTQLNGDTTLFINKEGEVKLPQYKFSSNGLVELKPLYIGLDGTITTSFENRRALTIHYSDFVPGTDGSLDEIKIAVTNGNGFAQVNGSTLGDNGVMLAPINIPQGAKLFFVEINYINESDEPFTFELIEESLTNGNAFPTILLNTTLDEGGTYESGNFVRTNITGKTVGIDPAIITSSKNRVYTARLNCSDCSNQYIKRVRFLYIPEFFSN